MSNLLQALYRGDRAKVDELLAADPTLDVFEAAAVGRTDRLRELLDEDLGRRQMLVHTGAAARVPVDVREQDLRLGCELLLAGGQERVEGLGDPLGLAPVCPQVPARLRRS